MIRTRELAKQIQRIISSHGLHKSDLWPRRIPESLGSLQPHLWGRANACQLIYQPCNWKEHFKKWNIDCEVTVILVVSDFVCIGYRRGLRIEECREVKHEVI